MAAPLPPPVALPAQPNDPMVPLPAAPAFPPTVNDVLGAVRYRRNVDVSINAVHPPGVGCTPNDRYNSVIYEHSVVAQAAAAADPQAAAPPWFQGAIHQLRLDLRNDMRAMILPDLKRLTNQRRGDGTVVPFEMVPFINGSDPTQQPHNLPPLPSVNAVDNLNGQDLRDYLTGYGAVPLPAAGNPNATNRLRKEILKRLVGASM